MPENQEPLLKKKTHTNENDLKRNFKKLVFVIVFASIANSFMVLFHSLDVENSEETLRYKLGTVAYFVLFIALFSVQVIVLIDGFETYHRWRRLILPTNE